MKTAAEMVDLRERIATCGVFAPDETAFILDAVNASTVPELVSPDGREPGRIDAGNTIALAHQLLRPIRRHYVDRPMSRDRVLEVLNALAFVLEAVLSATNHDEKALAFFEQARKQNRMEG